MPSLARRIRRAMQERLGARVATIPMRQGRYAHTHTPEPDGSIGIAIAAIAAIAAMLELDLAAPARPANAPT